MQYDYTQYSRECCVGFSFLVDKQVFPQSIENYFNWEWIVSCICLALVYTYTFLLESICRARASHLHQEPCQSVYFRSANKFTFLLLSFYRVCLLFSYSFVNKEKTHGMRGNSTKTNSLNIQSCVCFNRATIAKQHIRQSNIIYSILRLVESAWMSCMQCSLAHA